MDKLDYYSLERVSSWLHGCYEYEEGWSGSRLFNKQLIIKTIEPKTKLIQLYQALLTNYCNRVIAIFTHYSYNYSYQATAEMALLSELSFLPVLYTVFISPQDDGWS